MRNEDPAIQIRKLTDDDRDYLQSTTAAERLGMMWQLT
jgi:hypothetical protein